MYVIMAKLPYLLENSYTHDACSLMNAITSSFN